MKFSPKHEDNVVRAIYGALIVMAVAFANIGTGLTRTIFMCLAVVCLGIGLFLFMSHEMTTYTYIAIEKDKGIDFYVDKAIGKRGAYVCFFPLCDCVALEKYEKGAKKKLATTHGRVSFYNYCHNVFCGEKYVMVFKNDDHCDAVICQLDEKSYLYLNKAISLSQSETETEV